MYCVRSSAYSYFSPSYHATGAGRTSSRIIFSYQCSQRRKRASLLKQQISRPTLLEQRFSFVCCVLQYLLGLLTTARILFFSSQSPHLPQLSQPFSPRHAGSSQTEREKNLINDVKGRLGFFCLSFEPMCIISTSYDWNRMREVTL